MEKITDIKQMFKVVCQARTNGKSVGVVPTMGALHDGHLSLVDQAKAQCDFVVVTIFVNPTQFAPQEDLDQYPRPIDSDLEKLSARAVDVAFCPQPEDVYPPGFSTYVEPPEIAKPFEGSSRATHFRGVATVVLKLFHMVPADKAFFGQKDYQQTLVVRKMVDDLNVPIEIVVCPTTREADGLALSSRNAYLSVDERRQAAGLYQGLRKIKEDLSSGVELSTALVNGKAIVEPMVDDLEYLTVVDAETLQEVDGSTGPLIALVAAKVGSTRLIDNMLIDDS